MPGTVLSHGDSVIHRTDKVPALLEFGETVNK